MSLSRLPEFLVSTSACLTLAVGTAITNQYSGVTFSLNGAPGTPTIGQTAAGLGQINTTSSGTRFLKGPPDSGSPCPTMRMVFTNLQREVHFQTGIFATISTPPPFQTNGQSVTVVAYDNAGTLIAALTTTVNISAAESGVIDTPIDLVSTTQHPARRNLRPRQRLRRPLPHFVYR